MNREDQPKFKAMIAAMYELYRQGKNLSPTTMSLWYRALEGYELEVISAALSRHSRNPDTGQFLPLPADVVRLIEGSSDDVALQAWHKLDRALRSIGTYQTVVFDDPVIHYCVAGLGGWIKLGTFTEDDWKFQRQAFITLYRGARQRAPEYPRLLLGIAAADNGEKHRERPVMVGDYDRCLLTMKGGTDAPAITMRPLGDLLPQLPDQRAA